MKVLSLFDWIACWYEALVKAGIRVDKYYASEIDKYAIQIALKNHPDIIEIWDVCDVKWEDYQDIDLLIWGSPCQWFSVAWRQLNFEDPRSKLFFEFVRILKEVKPKYFLLENVKMKREFQDKISELVWCEPIEINSSLVSAQNRRRLYRTNIPEIMQPKDRGIYLKDILEEDVDKKYYFSKERWDKITEWRSIVDIWGGHEKKIMVSYAPWSRDYYNNGWRTDKCPTICARDYKDPKVIFLPCWTQYSWSDSFGNSFGSPRGYTLRASCPNGVMEDVWIIRKLTPVECERLQTLPDNYTEGVSDTQRYKMLWNWWTVDVISHIFSYIK